MSSKSLIALAVIAAATIAADQAEIPEGATFEAPDDIATQLVASGHARLADAAPTAQSAPAKPAKSVRVRLLVASEHGQPNDVRDLPADTARTLVKAGDADDEKAAVAYAAALPQNQKKT